jgi:transcriptional regulator with XRE-family HTH domain
MDDSFMIEVTSIIRKRRQELKLSQKELAMLVGTHRTWITNLENMRSESITTKMLSKVLTELRIDLKLTYDAWEQ